MNIPYQEGTLFAVPLRAGGFAVGLVARATSDGKVILCFFFGPQRAQIPTLAELGFLTPMDAIRVFRVGDLSLLKGEWPIIGPLTSWKRENWKMPPFVRRDSLTRKAGRVYYSDVDPNVIASEENEPYDSCLERDAVLGAGAVELVLTKLLTDFESGGV